jgi:glucokinase
MRKGKDQKLPVLAVDLGGTKIIIAIMSHQGEIIARQSYNTLADEGPQAVMNRIFSSIEEVLSQNNLSLSQLSAISIAAAGIIDIKNGVITEAPNLSGWHDIPLKSIVEEKFKLTTFLINDADAAALGEHRFGAGKGLSNLILLTLGTGVGGGIIINSGLYLGSSGSAAEIGHMIIDVNGPKCQCGNNGCLEAFVSGSAIAAEAKSRISQGGKSSLIEMAEGKIENITAEKVYLAAGEGDSLASEVISRAAYYLGIGVVNLVNILNPEMVIIGGSVASMGDILLEPVRQVVKEKAFPLLSQAVKIVPARLGNDAGIFGAAIFALEQ